MKKNKRKRYFSIIFVPDQEQSPKSISMSNAQGKMVLFFAALLSVHIIMGGVAYYRTYRLEKSKRQLTEENEQLTLVNRKIETIAEEHIATKRVIDKIYKAFGTELGVSRQEFGVMSTLEVPQTEALPIPAIQGREAHMAVQYQDRLPYLIDAKTDFFTPAHLPTRLPVEGFMTTRFQRGEWFVGRRHMGIDIAAERGTSIRAAGTGVVVFANWTPDFGNLVVLSHGRGYYSYYGHANHFLVGMGDNVRKGDVIALLGSSGFSSAPHLHFEIWKDGKALDPASFLYAIPQQSLDN